MSPSHVFQIGIILLGLYIGAHLSNRANLLHEKIEHVIPVAHTSMEHGLLEVSEESSVPSLDSIIVAKDKMSGWNVTIKTSNFTFTPENVNKPHQSGEGHAHVYINGEKFSRIYGPSFHLPELIGSEHVLKITLNANGHETMAIRNVAIEKVVIIE